MEILKIAGGIILAILMGAIAGVIVNYLGDVLPRYRKFAQPRCIHCDQPLRWREYLLFSKCSACGQKRSIRSWLVPGLAIAISIFLWLIPPVKLGYWLAMLIYTFFGVVALIDIEHRLVLHPVSIFGAIFGLVLGFWLHDKDPQTMDGIITTLIGGAAGFLIMLLLYYLGILFSNILSKIRGEEIEEVALGFGDVNLAGVLGLMMGWPLILANLLFAILGGGLISALMIIGMKLTKKYRAFVAIPYAPFLIISAAIILYMQG